MYKFLNNISLKALDKNTYRKENLIKTIVYKFFKKLFDFSFIKLYGYSQYDPRAQCDHDLYMEQLEYEARQNMEYDY
tara:strand:+ start:131 stop:361 length:231 start_codon:yes stop_codon:yes gene_type:complete